jgi:DNA-binding MarR family transcriptional regulator
MRTPAYEAEVSRTLASTVHPRRCAALTLLTHEPQRLMSIVNHAAAISGTAALTPDQLKYQYKILEQTGYVNRERGRYTSYMLSEKGDRTGYAQHAFALWWSVDGETPLHILFGTTYNTKENRQFNDKLRIVERVAKKGETKVGLQRALGIEPATAYRYIKELAQARAVQYDTVFDTDSQARVFSIAPTARIKRQQLTTRQQEIVLYLARNSANIETLAESLNACKSSIYKNIAYLHKQGIITGSFTEGSRSLVTLGPRGDLLLQFGEAIEHSVLGKKSGVDAVGQWFRNDQKSLGTYIAAAITTYEVVSPNAFHQPAELHNKELLLTIETIIANDHEPTSTAIEQALGWKDSRVTETLATLLNDKAVERTKKQTPLGPRFVYEVTLRGKRLIEGKKDE